MKSPRQKKAASATAQAREHAEFLHLAYAALVVRGFDRERDIPDPILRKVWRLGKRIKAVRLQPKRAKKAT